MAKNTIIKTRKYRYFKIYFEPIDPKYCGSNHSREYKAIDIEHAMKQAKKDETWRNDEDRQVYRLTGEWKEIQ